MAFGLATRSRADQLMSSLRCDGSSCGPVLWPPELTRNISCSRGVPGSVTGGYRMRCQIDVADGTCAAPAVTSTAQMAIARRAAPNRLFEVTTWSVPAELRGPGTPVAWSRTDSATATLLRRDRRRTVRDDDDERGDRPEQKRCQEPRQSATSLRLSE